MGLYKISNELHSKIMCTFVKSITVQFLWLFMHVNISKLYGELHTFAATADLVVDVSTISN